MVMAALHGTGEVGLVGSAELPQPDSIAANATHTGIRIITIFSTGMIASGCSATDRNETA